MFGTGTGTRARLADETESLGCRRALLLATPGMDDVVDTVRSHLGTYDHGLFDGAAMHTPVEVTDKATEAVRKAAADCVVAVGGGSAIGLGKAIALRTDLPQIVLPTTYAGSEVTPVIGETSEGHKTTQRTLAVLPETVIYDVELTLGLPAPVSAASGVNAMAHAAEALVEPGPQPAHLGPGGTIAARPVPGAAEDRRGAGRTRRPYGCAVRLLAGRNVPGHRGNGPAPQVVATSSAACPTFPTRSPTPSSARTSSRSTDRQPRPPSGRIADALGTDAHDAASTLRDFTENLGLPVSLHEVGMPEDGIDRVCQTNGSSKIFVGGDRRVWRSIS